MEVKTHPETPAISETPKSPSKFPNKEISEKIVERNKLLEETINLMLLQPEILSLILGSLGQIINNKRKLKEYINLSPNTDQKILKREITELCKKIKNFIIKAKKTKRKTKTSKNKKLTEIIQRIKALRIDRNELRKTAEKYCETSKNTVVSTQLGKNWGDITEIRNSIIEELRGWVTFLVSKFKNPKGGTRRDYCQEGVMALMKAIEYFDPGRETLFSSYASTCVFHEIEKVSKDSGLVRIPRNNQEILETLIEKLDEEGGNMDFSQLSSETGVSRKLILSLLAAGSDSVSLDERYPASPEDEEDEDTAPEEAFHEQIEGKAFSNSFSHIDLSSDLQDIFIGLSDQQRAVIKMRFSLTEDGHTYTLDEIGKMLNISGEAVRQIEAKALEKLRILGNRTK